MVAKAASYVLAATAFAVLVGAGLGADSARAQGATCLASPNGPAPPGSHWYYKTDQATHQKCWYTRPRDQAAQAAPAQTVPTAGERGDAANPGAISAPDQSAAPIALAPAPLVQERPAPPARLPPRHAAAAIARIPVPTADPRGEQQPVTAAAAAVPDSSVAPAAPDNVAWPDPPPMPQTAGAAGSPFPPPPDFSSQPGQPAPSAAAQNGSPAAEGSSAAPTAPLNATGQPEAAENPGNGTAAGKAPPSPAQAPSRISVLLVLAGLVVLLAVGMLLRRAVEHALSRRRVIKLARQEPRLMEPAAVPPPMPTLVWQAPSVVPAHAQTQTEQRASEVEAALRKLAQNLRQRRPAANGAIGRTGAAVRTG